LEIHKPKPVHSLREFLSEIGVVVLGIIIALGGEQLIDHLRDRRLAAEARESIREEIAYNVAVLARRTAIQSCVDRRLDEVLQIIDAGGQPGYVAPTWIGRPQIWEMVHAKWQAASQAGRAPLLSDSEQAQFGMLYALFADIAADQDREQTAWTRLHALEGLAHPSPGLGDSLRLELQDARYVNADIRGLSTELQDLVKKQKIAMRDRRVRGRDGICFPTNTSRIDALGRLSKDSGTEVFEP
jgi:hypothetical protein